VTALPVETPAYHVVGGEQLYTVHHRARGGECRGVVILAGPLATERAHAYLTWVRWAREIANGGFDAFRFDYRGTGESTGEFASMTMDTWLADLHACIEHVARARPGVPIVLHGLRMGALLAARAFAEKRADAMLLWEPPQSARALLAEVLRRKLAEDYAENPGAPRKTRDAYVAELERGELVEVEGYDWSNALWASAEVLPLEVPDADDKRPWRIVHLDARGPERFVAKTGCSSVRIPRPAFWMDVPVLKPALNDLFVESTSWLVSTFGGAS
jgi:alpha/beta superfamily hydrolase